MAVGRKTILLLGLTLTAALGGCEGMTMDQVFGIGDANTATTELTPPPPPPPTPTPAPTPKPSPPAAPVALKRNVAFDVLRSRGIAQVFEGHTKIAVGTFQSAQRMKPKDGSVELWLDAIQISSDRQKARFAKKTDFGSAYTFGQIQPPAPVGGMTSAGGGVPAPPGTAGGTGASAKPTPAASLAPVDPRLVF